jgi:hypothetical protein
VNPQVWACREHTACADVTRRPVAPAPSFDAASYLRIIGRRADLHPYDVYAWTFPDREAAERSQAVDRDHFGYDPLPVITVEAHGIVAGIDLRPVLVASGCPPTDPTLPDNYPKGA